MPRLPDAAIRQGLLHPDSDVRSAALHYFSDALSPDPSVMPVVIESLDRYGRTQAFPYPHLISPLTQSESTVRWAVHELTTRPRRAEDERDYINSIARLLVRADPRLVRPVAAEILAAPAVDKADRERLSRRLGYQDWDADALWRELDAVCEEGKDKVYAGELRWPDGQDLVEEIARRGDSAAGRTLDLLAVRIDDYANNPLTWLEPLAVRLAGELRLESAIPLILERLRLDAEVVNEECQTALVRIGTDAAVRAVWDAYPSAEWHFRLYATGVFGRVHTESAVTAGIDLLGRESDPDLRSWLAQALVDQFSTEANEAARRELLDDPDQLDLRDNLVTACALMGQDLPDLKRWRMEMWEERRRTAAARARSSTPPVRQIPAAPFAPAQVRVERRVGRNDPCPCGSGKKFKQCCLRT